MWKIVIADDEAKIRRGLRAEIERMGLPVTVVGEAQDGLEAMHVCEQVRPDILLVDINMPFVSGLAFIEQLRQSNQEARIIVVTGYEEFEYARSAVALGVQAYLLKPVEVEELKAALQGCLDELSRVTAHNRHYEWALKQLSRRREYLLEQFLRDMIAGQWTEAEIIEQLAYFNVPPMSHIVLLMVAVRTPDLLMKPWDDLMRQLVLTDVLRERLAELNSAHWFCDERGNVLLLCDANAGQMQALMDTLVDTIERELAVKTEVAWDHTDTFGRIDAVYDRLIEKLTGHMDGSPAVEIARKYIDAHLAKVDLGLDEVAQAAGVHPTYLSKLMKREMGTSFAKYLTAMRIHRAVQMMQHSERKLRDISLEVGYATPHYFSAAFKKLLGVSPNEYRSEEKGK